MSKLNLDALRMRAESIVSAELMASISGGTANACHDKKEEEKEEKKTIDYTGNPIADPIIGLINLIIIIF